MNTNQKSYVFQILLNLCLFKVYCVSEKYKWTKKKGVSCVDLGSGFVFWMPVPALIDLP